MSYHCVVLAKQVPDTKRITGDAMKEDGTVNRGALPAVFNPEDLNALEAALAVKQTYGGRVSLITMGLPAAAEILREGLYRGVDKAILITDRRCAASDTLATSYILSCAVRKLDGVDMVFCGRQAIDGDTAQVGPQAAEKLGLPQITYVEELIGLDNGKITARRNLGNGWEVVEGSLPVLLTITDAANEARPPGAKKVFQYKKARCPAEVAGEVAKKSTDASESDQVAETQKRCNQLADKGLLMTQWNLDDLAADLAWCGRDGSPTKVNRIQSVVLTTTEHKKIDTTQDALTAMIHELIEDHTLG